MGISLKSGIEEGCSRCSFQPDGFSLGSKIGICGLFDRWSSATFYPQNAKLFTEGQSPQGVFIICSGRAKLTISSRNGKSLMRIIGSGEILGLSATLAGRPYEVSAEMFDPGRINFIRRDIFLEFVNRNADLSLRVAHHLSRDYFAVHDQVRALALSDSVAEKLAKLLLSWCEKGSVENEQGIHLKMSLTHGEIAQMIGASRETVTRLLSEFKNREIIRLKGATLTILDRPALENFVNR